MLRIGLLTALSAALIALAFPAFAAGGLYYQRYEGNFGAIPDFASLTATASGITTEIDGPAGGPADGAVRLLGDLLVDQTGAYTFDLTSSHAARVSVDGLVVVSGTGSALAGTITLSAGRRKIEIAYLTPAAGANIAIALRKPGETAGEALIAALSLPATLPGSVDPQLADGQVPDDAATRGPRLGPSLTPTQAGGLLPVLPRPVAVSQGGLNASGKSIREVLAQRSQTSSAMGLPDTLLSAARRDGVRDAIGTHLLGSAFQLRLAQGDIAYVLVEDGAGSGMYRIGRSVPIAANTPATGYEFDRWIGGILALDDPAAARTTLRVPSGGASLRATYRPVIGAGQGLLQVTNGTGTGVYAIGTRVDIVAGAAPAGKVFARWAGDTAVLDTPFVPTPAATVPAGTTKLGAVYRSSAQTTFTVSVFGGTGSGTYAAGTSLAIAASPGAGETFQRWAGDTQLLADPTAASAQIIVPSADVVLEAVYSALQANVTVNGGEGSGLFRVGARVVISANAPAAGETFRQWTGDTASIADPASAVTVLTVPSNGAAVTATYEATPIAVSRPLTGSAVDERGFTVAGSLSNASAVNGLTLTVRVGGATVVNARPVGFNRSNGAFAARIFDDEVPAYSDVGVELVASLAGGATSRARIGLRARPSTSDVRQLMDRITFGATPALIDEVTEKGFDVFLAEQLNPGLIDDRAFLATNPDSYFNPASGDKITQLLQIKLAYAIGSKRQLREVMGAFWENHFYTSPAKEQDYLGELRELSAFRVNALGYFRDLLHLSARSSVMMSFLDNDDSVRGRLNENYARELMELHTVGVDGGYGNDDVIAVAKILTGWRERSDGIERPMGYARVREFYFDAAAHEPGDKFVPFLNRTFVGRTGAAGIEEGNEFLDALAIHPSTARFVCGKLVAFFVNAEPPQSLVDACREEWLASNGHVGSVLTTILTSPLFHSSAQHYRSNFKTPFEYVVSVPRAFDMRVRDEADRDDLYAMMSSAVRQAGQDYYQFPVPTGFPEEVGDWSGAASLVRRFQFGIDMARGAAPGDIEWNFAEVIRRAPAGTAEGVAMSFFELATGDRYTREEFDAVVDALYGADDAFDASGDERQAMIRAMQLIVAMPSFQYQ